VRPDSKSAYQVELKKLLGYHNFVDKCSESVVRNAIDLFTHTHTHTRTHAHTSFFSSIGIFVITISLARPRV
jgi:hypothetical protein